MISLSSMVRPEKPTHCRIPHWSMSPPRGAVTRTLRMTTLFASTRMSPTRSMFSTTAPSVFTLISPFLGTRWVPGLTPVVPALGQPAAGGLAEDDGVDVLDADVGFGVGDDVEDAFEADAEAEVEAEFEAWAGVGVD